MRKLTRRAGPLVTILAVAVIAAACSKSTTTVTSGGASGGTGSTGGGFQGTSLTGAGATFPAPVYALWFQKFKDVEPGALINYQAIGSGGGISQIAANTVDFGASDAPLQPTDIQTFNGRKILEFPTVVGGIALAYNISVHGLKLDGPTAADIFLGKITKWNDPRIQALNSSASLPDEKITVVHRADSSGTTFVFTSWLAKESAEWNSKVGADKAVQWPVGIGANGNDGVAAGINQTDGAIGYVEYQYAITTGLGMALIHTDQGQDLIPSVNSISTAAQGLTLPITPTSNILNSSTPGAYPISSTTYLLVPQDLTPLGQDKAQTLVDFLQWALTDGQKLVTSLNYAPLPDAIAKQDLDNLSQLQFNGKTLAPSSSVS
jgi:phosphate transport system substrate-binding protein